MRNYIKLSAIVIAPDRQRKEFKEDELRTLAESIRTKGLFHPIILRVVGDSYVLVAGERRLRAVQDLWDLGQAFMYDGAAVPSDSIPYANISDLSDLEIEEAELEENVQRTQLTWQERAAAHAKLHTLRSKQAEALGAPAHTIADTALEVRGSSAGVNQENTRREIIIANHLDNPAVRAAKTAEEAFKILRKEEAQAKSRDLGISVGKTFNASMHRAINEDSLAWMRSAPAEQFDCILTDPPYGMGADEFGDSGGVAAGAHGYKDDADNFLSIIKTLAPESFRLAKAQAHMYCFCDIDWFFHLRDEFRAAGWQVFRTPWIWYKRAGMRAPWPDSGPQRKYETLLYAVKGKCPVLRMGPDVLDFGPDANLGHAAQKPVALFRDLLTRTCLPGNTVFDPFMGSGTIFPAAHGLKLIATGIEMDPASYGIAVKRIQDLEASAQLELALGL